LSQRLIHEAPLVSLASLSNLDKALREQAARFGSPIVGGHWAVRDLQ
jgi:selenophosphate synthetase-related protein